MPPDVVSLVVLPPLLYAASEELSWRDLLAVWRPVLVLAVGLVLASAAAVAAVAGAVAAIPASMAFVLGAVLASTDPVAVSALGRRLSLPPKVQALVQAESLFNDATSLVLFQIAVSFAVAGTAGRAAPGGALLHGAGGQFAILAAGGAAVGGVLAAGIVRVRRRVTDPVLETVFALVTPYAAYVLGAALHASPVTAVIIAGLVIGGQRELITTAPSRLQLHSVYQTVIFLLESVVFSLIGLQLPTPIRDLSGGGAWAAEALAVAGTLMLTRIVWVFPLSAVVQRRSGVRRPSWPVPAVVSWAGTRGVVPLAAALSIPLTSASGIPLSQRDLILVIATAVIVISLCRARPHPGTAGPPGRDRAARRDAPRGDHGPAAPGRGGPGPAGRARRRRLRSRQRDRPGPGPAGPDRTHPRPDRRRPGTGATRPDRPGDVRDQAQLYGLLGRLQEFGIELLAVEPADGPEGGGSGSGVSLPESG